MTANNAVPAEEVRVAVEQVHGATLAAHDAVDAAEQLRHDGSRRHATGERLAVIAVGRDHVVVGAQDRDRPCAARFLPDVQVTEATDLA